MALEKKQKIYVKTRANFDVLLKNGTIGNDHLVFIEDTHEVWTHGKFFSGSAFRSISDGTNTASANTIDGTIPFIGAGKTTVTVGTSGVTITGASATVATGDNAGEVKIDGVNAKVNDWDDVSGKAKAAVPNTTKVNGHALSGDITLDAGDVGLGNVTNESKETMFTSPEFTGTPVAPTAAAGTNTTQVATTEFVTTAVGNLLGASEAMIFKGTLGATDDGSTVQALPASHKAGDTYRVVTAGTWAGKVCETGDMIVCITKGTAANDAHWTVIQTNIDGAVTGPASSVGNNIAIFSGATGKVIKDSGFSIKTSVPENAVFTDDSVTAVGKHYTPEADDASKLTATGADGSTSGTIQFVTALTRDAAGHIVGIESGAITVPTTLPASDVIDTFDKDSSAPVSGKAVQAAIEGLDVTNITANLSAGKTITALSEADGKISATASDIAITALQATLSSSYAKAESGNTNFTAGSTTIETAIGGLAKALDDLSWAEFD